MALFIETLIVSLIGGFTFNFLKIPLPWLLGPLVFIMLWKSTTKRALFWPVWLRNIGLVVLGLTIGISFTVETGWQILKQLPSIVLATVFTLSFSLLVGYFTSRKTGLTLATSIMGSIPGGLPQMVALSEEIKDTDVTVITFMQTVRIMSVIFIVPFIVIHGLAKDISPTTGVGSIAGSVGLLLTSISWHTLLFLSLILMAVWFSLRVNLPTPYLIGPILGSIILVLAGYQVPTVPTMFVVASQICIGSYMGLTTNIRTLAHMRKVLLYVLGGNLAIVLFSFSIGYILTCLYPLNLIDAFLGTAPGGIAEMGITALQVHADISLITAYQMFRLLLILFLVPVVLKKWFGSVPRIVKGSDINPN